MKLHQNIKSRFFLPVALLVLCLLLAAAGCSNAQMAEDNPEAPGTAQIEENQSQVEAPVEQEEVVEEPDEQAQEAAPAGGSLDINSLISLEEVSALLGEPVLAPEYSENAVIGQEILFFAAEAETLPLRFFQLSITMGNAAMDAASIYTETRDTLLGEEAQAVEGYGDDAVWGPMGLHILKGDTYLTLSVGNSDVPENLELAKKFADVILPRIP